MGLKNKELTPDNISVQDKGTKKEKRRWSTKKWISMLVLLLVVFVLVPVVNELIPQRVNVNYIGFDGEKTKEYWTRAHRVSEFTAEHTDDIMQEDIMTGPVNAGDIKDAFVTHDMMLTVIKAEEAKARIGGKKEAIYIYPTTVEETLGYNKIDYDEDDVIKPALDAKLESGDVIRITRVQIKKKNKTLDIEPVEKDAVFDNSLSSGTIVRSEGKPGKAVYTYTYKYVNGKKIKTTKKFKKWKKKPVDIQLRFGTSETGETGPVSYSETFTGNCTAYYAGNNAHGATGQRCYYGTCAVDPKVIPYGTKLYVEGYGTAIANDCGGAVKGHIIDLYMRSTKECFSWGRRNKKVYVLK